MPSLPNGWLPLSPSYIEILEPILFILGEPPLKQKFGRGDFDFSYYNKIDMQPNAKSVRLETVKVV